MRARCLLGQRVRQGQRRRGTDVAGVAVMAEMVPVVMEDAGSVWTPEASERGWEEAVRAQLK